MHKIPAFFSGEVKKTEVWTLGKSLIKRVFQCFIKSYTYVSTALFCEPGLHPQTPSCGYDVQVLIYVKNQTGVAVLGEQLF